MLSIGKLSAASVDYYTEQLSHSVGEDVPVLRSGQADRRADYYAGYQAPARWMGAGLEAAGINPASPVSKEAFAQLMGHETLTGESMTRARAAHGCVAAFDHTLSAPKSVSLLYAFSDSQTRQQVREAHQEAVSQAVEFMEAHCSQARVGTRWRDEHGRWRVSTRNVDADGWVAAAFDHYTSRANDPQLHTHVVVINRVNTDDGWRALDARRNYMHAKAGGTIYEGVLRDELTRRLGVSWGPVVNGIADIAGYSPDLLQHFSTRRAEILEAVEAYVARSGGRPHGRMLQKFTLETRQPKAHPRGEALVTREMRDYGVGEDVVAYWQRRAAEVQQDPVEVARRVIGFAGDGLHPDPLTLPETVGRIVEAVTGRQATFTVRDLMVEVAASFPDGITSAGLTRSTTEVLESALASGEVVPLPSHRTDHRWLLPDDVAFTTRTQLDRERRVLAAVNERSPVKPDLQRLQLTVRVRELVPEQESALHRLAGLEGRLVVVAAPGGSGKTYAAGAYADAVQAAGHPVLGVTTTATAAQKLAQDLRGHWTGTIAMLTYHLDRRGESLLPGTVVICDEGSMVSTTDLARLTDLARKCDGKLILLGDPQQLPSIDSGGLFHRIVADGRGVVTDLGMVNQRQRHELDRQALRLLRSGEAHQAVLDYTEAGRVHIGRERLDTMAAMVDAWWKDTRVAGIDGVRMLTARRSDVAVLNHLARSHMQTEGLLTGPTLETWTGLTLQTGDRIVVRTNWYAHCDLRNGQTGTVTAVNPETGRLTFRRDHDGIEVILPKRYVERSVDYGYAQTIHTAQGHTYNHVHVYVNQTMTAEHGYTGFSRARGETHIWTADPPGPLRDCSHIDCPSVVEDRTEVLVYQLSRGGVRPIAADHDPSVQLLTDRELLDRRDALIQVISNGAGRHSRPDVDALDASIGQAQAAVERLGTSGARRQLAALAAQRHEALTAIDAAEQWVQDNPDLIQEYRAVSRELDRRVTARTLLYQANPPADLLETLGPRARATDPKAWDVAVAAYAIARLESGPDVDLGDPATHHTGPWRDAVRHHHFTEQDVPVLKLTG